MRASSLFMVQASVPVPVHADLHGQYLELVTTGKTMQAKVQVLAGKEGLMIAQMFVQWH